MDAIFQRLLANNFSELPGLRVEASIPVPESLVNEIVEVSLRGNRSITCLRMNIHGDNRVVADMKSPLLPWTMHLKLKLFRSADFTGSPKVEAFLENHLLLGKLGSLFHMLPKGVTLHNNQIAVDLESFLPSEQRRLLALVKSAEIQTEEGKVILHVKMEN
jgi:hypothetical protein